MSKNPVLLVLLSALFLHSCISSKKMKYKVTQDGVVKSETHTMDYLEQLLLSDNRLSPYINLKDSFRLQVIYTQIDRGKNNKPSFKDYYYNVNPANYFYPASTVKMPSAMLALEKLHRINVPGLDLTTTMVTDKAYGRQTAVLVDPSSPDGRPTIGQYIKKIFLVSDNDAQNRIYEFLGQKYLNESLRSKGYPESEIVHRLQISLPEEENRRTNPVSFLDRKGQKIWAQNAEFNSNPYFKRHDSLGSGYLIGGKLVPTAMDFSNRNRISLLSLHNILKSIMFPNSVKPENQFQVSDADLDTVRKYMSMWPGESNYPSYKSPLYYPAYSKFLLYGASKNAKLLPGVRIFNKTGNAYGFLIDVAYFADFDNQVEFMLSAVIYCNKDGILNDDKYDYEESGFPFMKLLGEKIYDYELKRVKEYKPNLNEFKFQY